MHVLLLPASVLEHMPLGVVLPKVFQGHSQRNCWSAGILHVAISTQQFNMFPASKNCSSHTRFLVAIALPVLIHLCCCPFTEHHPAVG
jgi:hypothetical protein